MLTPPPCLEATHMSSSEDEAIHGLGTSCNGTFADKTSTMHEVLDGMVLCQKEMIEHLRLRHESFLDNLGMQLDHWMQCQGSALGLEPEPRWDVPQSTQSQRGPQAPQPMPIFWIDDGREAKFKNSSDAQLSGRAVEDLWEGNCDTPQAEDAAASPSHSSQTEEVHASPLLGRGSELRSENRLTALRVAMVFDQPTTSLKRVPSISKSRLAETEQNPLKKFIMSQKFDYMSALLVITNAAFIGVQVEFMFHTSNTPAALDIVDYVFCIAFVAELILRLHAFRLKGYFLLYDVAWNWFDFIIISLSTVDTLLSIVLAANGSPLGSLSALRVIRIVRFTRAFRVIRMMKFFKDLRILMAAIGSTLKVASMALLLLTVSMYMFGIAIAQITAEHVRQKRMEDLPLTADHLLLVFFGSLSRSMWTLFMTIAGGIDWNDATQELYELPLALVIFIVYVLFSYFCLMNVVTGIFCHSAIETFENDKEKLIEYQLAEKSRFVDTLNELFAEVDDDGDGKCTLDEFERLLRLDDGKGNNEMAALLNTLDIETRDGITLFTMMDPDGRGLSVEEFIHGCITLRGGAKAVHLERISHENKVNRKRMEEVSKTVENLRSDIKRTFSNPYSTQAPTACQSPPRSPGGRRPPRKLLKKSSTVNQQVPSDVQPGENTSVDGGGRFGSTKVPRLKRMKRIKSTDAAEVEPLTDEIALQMIVIQ